MKYALAEKNSPVKRVSKPEGERKDNKQKRRVSFNMAAIYVPTLPPPGAKDEN